VGKPFRLPHFLPLKPNALLQWGKTSESPLNAGFAGGAEPGSLGRGEGSISQRYVRAAGIHPSAKEGGVRCSTKECLTSGFAASRVP